MSTKIWKISVKNKNIIKITEHSNPCIQDKYQPNRLIYMILNGHTRVCISPYINIHYHIHPCIVQYIIKHNLICDHKSSDPKFRAIWSYMVIYSHIWAYINLTQACMILYILIYYHLPLSLKVFGLICFNMVIYN